MKAKTNKQIKPMSFAGLSNLGLTVDYPSNFYLSRPRNSKLWTLGKNLTNA